MTLLLDEQLPAALAERLRGRGYDAVGVLELPELQSRPDQEVLEYATADRRVLLTENVRDFMLLHAEWRKGGASHFGLLFTSPRRFPRTKQGLGPLVRALTHVLETMPEDDALEGGIAWL